MITFATAGFLFALLCWCCCGGCYIILLPCHWYDHGFTSNYFLPGRVPLYGIGILSVLELIVVPLISYGVLPIIFPLGLAFPIGIVILIIGFMFHIFMLVFFYKLYGRKEDEILLPRPKWNMGIQIL